MPKITLARRCRQGVSPRRSPSPQVAAAIGPGLAKAALAGNVDGKLVDTSHRDRSRRRARDRHRQGSRGTRSAAPLDRAPARLRGEGALPRRAGDDRPGDRGRLLLRLLVQAPVHARGPRGDRDEDGRAREEGRARHAQADAARRRRRVLQVRIGEHYKAEIIASIPANEPISLYTEGKFTDLCRGPHVPSTGKLKVFKLMKVAGAYWRGDSKNEMLQRIYGTAWAKKEDLDAYLHRIEEAEKRDHRQARSAARPLPPAGRGAGHGVLASEGLDDLAAGRAVHAPRLPGQRLPGSARAADPRPLAVGEVRPLGELQGEHVHDRVGEARLRDQADELSGPRADLQLRPAQLPRPAAALRRVRRLPPQRAVRRAARHHARARLHAGRRPHLLHGGADPAGGHGVQPAGARGLPATSASTTSRSRSRCAPTSASAPTRPGIAPRTRCARRSAPADVEWTELPGEGAFYGPKIEYHLKDSIGRSWQCGTMQVDFQMPGRLGAEYVDRRRHPQDPR